MRRYLTPKSTLGLQTGRCSFCGDELIIAMRCYFDGSETNHSATGDQWIILAGFCGLDIDWKIFERRWSKMLHRRYPIAPYVHMSQLMAHEDPFEQRNGWTDEKIDSLVSDALEVMDTMMSKPLRAISCRVNLSARARLVSEGKNVGDPMSICGQMCGAISMRHIIHKPEQMFYFFDRGEMFMAPFKKLWLTNRTPLGKLSIDQSKTVWDMIGNIEEADMESNPPLQAADMLAWSLNRELSDRTRLADLASRIRTFVSHEDDVRIDEDNLREKYIISSPASA